MDKRIAIAVLIGERCRELGLSRADLVRRMGYRNVPKGVRRLEQLSAGDLQRTERLCGSLPAALEIATDVVAEALEASRVQLKDADERAAAEREAAWRAAFVPHAIIVPERRVPQPIFIAVMVGVDRILRIDFDLAAAPDTYLRQALDGLGAQRVAAGIRQADRRDRQRHARSGGPA